MAIQDDITWRTVIVYAVIVLFGCLIVGKAVVVMTVEGKKWRSKAAASEPARPVVIPPNRGDICADDGRILATSVPFYELRFDPLAVKNKIFQEQIDSLAYRLSAFFRDGSKEFYKNKLVSARKGKHPNRYLLLNREKVNHTELKCIREFPIFRLGKNKGGFQSVVYNKRIQPHKNLAVRTIGYLNESKDGVLEGRVGLEAAFESELKGENGWGIKRMMSGTWMVLTEKEPVDGHDVITTIDVEDRKSVV